MNIKTFILTVCCVLNFSMLFAQTETNDIKHEIAQESPQGVRSIFGAELGLNSGIFYEQRLSDHFTLRASLGYHSTLSLDKSIFYQGFTPAARLSGRWYMSAIKKSNTNNNGFFLALETFYWEGGKAVIFAPKNNRFPLKRALGLYYSLGYNYDITEKIFLKAQAGLAHGLIFLDNNKTFYGTTDMGKLDLMVDLGVCFRF